MTGYALYRGKYYTLEADTGGIYFYANKRKYNLAFIDDIGDIEFFYITI